MYFKYTDENKYTPQGFLFYTILVVAPLFIVVMNALYKHKK